MKIQKLISRGLTLGFLLNSVSILSYANAEIPNRYQTLEGEYITIDDSTAGNLEEIEIFGNTVQDPDNLEDIQSVGDLYVDNEGNPILDKQGRKQYKIDILSEGGVNLINPSNIIIRGCNNDAVFSESGIDYITGDTTGYWARSIIEVEATLKANKKYAIFLDGESTGGLHDESRFNGVMGNQSSLGRINYFTPSEDGVLRLSLFLGRNELPFIAKNLKFMVSQVSVDKFIPYKKYKRTILLPCQLQKVGNIADRLYWDNEKSRYIIEKNVDTFTLNEAGEFRIDTYGGGVDYWAHIWTDLGIKKGYKFQSPIITNYNTTNNESTFIMYWTHQLRLLTRPWVIKEGTTSAKEVTKEEYLDFAQKNNIYKPDALVMVLNEVPKLIETNITSKLKILTYDEKTHIYVNSENGINPTLKVKVDRIEQASQEAVNIVLSNPTIYNISLARMLVNQLDESLYKDQLQSQLNELFSEDIIFEKKNTTANLDLYIKSENILQMSLNTNSITFDDFSGVEDMNKENAVNISINSSLPYSLNAYLPTEIQNSDKSTIMDKSILNIKENSEVNYQTFSNINEKLILKDNNPAGNNMNHGIDIKLKGNIAHQKDVYKTTIKFEAQQR